MGYIEEIRTSVGLRPLIFLGAVVLLVDDEDQVIMQRRKYPYGKRGSPDGLKELSESTEDAARRRV